MVGNQDELKKIFENEHRVVKQGKQILKERTIDNQSLLDAYQDLLEQYEKLLKSTQKVFKISDSQGRALKKREYEIEYLSYHDPLTSLFNRNYVEKMMTQLFKEESCFPLSVIIVDLNGLKLANDVFGHQLGDLLIQNAASIIKGCCRKSDIAARWGGDEFLILLPQTDEESVKNIIERINEKCRQTSSEPIEVSMAMGAASTGPGGGGHSSLSFNELLVRAEREMYKIKALEGQFIRKQILSKLVVSLETCCFEIVGHMERLSRMAGTFLTLLGVPEDSSKRNTFMLLVQLHDIGKIAIPKDILSKPRELTPAEWDVMRTHSEIGYRLAHSIGETEVAQAILAMHERWDGTGYPQGLKGEQIPYLSRILSILDVYDVITHDRTYKKAITRDEALIEIKRLRGQQFDPVLVDRFLGEYETITKKSKRKA